MDNTTRAIATFASRLTASELPDEIIDSAAVRLVDSIGCAIGGRSSKQAEIALRMAPEVDGSDSESIGRLISFSKITTPEHAAFANTCMIRNLDFNDRYPHVHPSDMLGALLALSTAPGVNGVGLATGIVSAYEVAARIADGAKMRHGWDSGYAVGVGAVAGIGTMLRSDVEQLGEALSLVTTANIHLRSTRAGVLSLWKGAATAHATFNAMLMSRLARFGMTGPEKSVEGRHGLWEQISGEFELDPFPGPDSGGPFRITQTSLKYWPVEFSAQTAVWAGVRLAQEVDVEDLESVTLGIHKLGWHEIGSEPAKWDPQSRETADHSMPYIFIRAMQLGRIDLSIFEPEQYLAADVRPLMAKVSVEADDECDAVHPQSMMLRCTAIARDGRRTTFVVKDPTGTWRNPMSEDEVKGKFLALARPVYGTRAEAIFDYWRLLPERDDLSEGLELLETT